MSTPYCLHYAPDNASLVIRLALTMMDQPFRTVLVDRAVREQDSEAYRALNPNGLIPVLETPQGPLFETAAILLWLADTHRMMAPMPDDTRRGPFLKWLFFLSNTLHADLRLVFYPQLYFDDSQDQTGLRQGAVRRLKSHLKVLNTAVDAPDWFGGVAEPYIACMLRWMAIYPPGWGATWFTLADYPALARLCERLEAHPATALAQKAEGLGPTPFTAPHPCNPPEGSAL